jgi:NADH-quinone oxidoreductase subunit N
VETIDDLAGLIRSRPWAAVLMTVFLFSLLGIPFTAGFNGKLLIFFGAVSVSSSGQVTLFRVLALLGVINSAIGAWYYLKIIAAMYLRTAIQPITRPAALPGVVAIVVCAILTIGLSIPPGAGWLLSQAHQARGAGTPPAPASQTAAR